MTICRQAARLLIILLLICSMNVVGAAGVSAQSGQESSGLQLRAKAAVLLDEDSGRLLFSLNPSQHMPPASLTKVMTALLVLENGDLDQSVYISSNAAETGESTVWLDPGEVLSRRELLYALLLSSANDAATALAESVAGTEENFVALMNERARQLQLNDTHFSNPHGLNAPDHYTSAYDLAVLTRQAMSDPVFQQIVDTKTMILPWPGHPWPRLLLNEDRLLYRYSGAIGVKTGYTREAGNCLIGAAQRGSMRLIAVVLNSPDAYGDTEKLLDYGFNNYSPAALNNGSQNFFTVRVVNGLQSVVTAQTDYPLIAAVMPDEEQELRYQAAVPVSVLAPVYKGAELGAVRIYLGNRLIGTMDVTAADYDAARPSPWSYLMNFWRSIWSRL